MVPSTRTLIVVMFMTLAGGSSALRAEDEPATRPAATEPAGQAALEDQLARTLTGATLSGRVYR